MTQAVIDIVANVGPVEASMDRLSRKARQDLQALRSLANAPLNVSVPAASAGIPNLPAGATSASVSQALGSTNPATVRETARLEAQRIGQERAILEKLKTQAGLVDDQNIIAKRQAALNTEANTVRQSLKAIGDDPTVFTKSVDSFRREQLSQLSRERVAAASSAYSATENAKVTDAARQRIRGSLTEIHAASGREAVAAIKAAKAAEREATVRAEGAKFGARAGSLTYAEKMGLNVSGQRGILGKTRSEVTDTLSPEEKTIFRNEAADAARREKNTLRDYNSVIESSTKARKESNESTKKVSDVEKQLAGQINRNVASAKTNLATAAAAGPRSALDVLKIAGASQRLTEIEKLNSGGAGTPELANESRALAKSSRDLSNRLNSAEKAHTEEVASTKTLTAEQKALRSQLLRNITTAQTNVASAVAAGARTPLDVLKIAGSSQRLSELRSGAESGSGLTGEALNEAKALANSTRSLAKRLTTAEAVHTEEVAATVALSDAERQLAQRTRSALARGNANVQQVLSNQEISPDLRAQAVALKSRLDNFAADNQDVTPTGATTEEARRLARESLRLRKQINANLASEAAATSPSDVLLGRTIDRRSARGIAEAEQILSTRGINGQDNFTAAAIKDRLTKLQAESAKTGPTAALANEAETLAAQAVGLRKTINAGLAKQGAAANATAQTDAISQQQSAQEAARERLESGRRSQLERQAFNKLLLDQGVPNAKGGYDQLGWYQRQQLRIGTGSASSRIDGVPPTARQALAGSFMTTTRFAASGAILYGGFQGISNAVQESRNLEKQLNLIEAQFKAIDKVDAFGQFKKDLFDIARQTGVATADIAEIGFQIQGAFGDQGSKVVTDNIRAGAELSQLTGLDNKEIVDSLTAASLAFDVNFRRIGDVTLQLQDRFGVLSKQTIQFLGDIAPTAQDAGFSLEEFGTIAAIIQQKSARGGAALAEGLARVLPAMKEQQEALLTLSGTESSLDTPEFLKAIATGDVKGQLIELSQNFGKLSKESQGYLINLLGGRREAQIILPLFNEQLDLLKEINKTQSSGDVLAERFAKFRETLDFQLDTLKQKFLQLGVELYESGLGEFLKNLGEAGAGAVGGITLLLRVFESFNSTLGGLPGRILAAIVMFKALRVVTNSLAPNGLKNAFTNVGGSLTSFGSVAAYQQARTPQFISQGAGLPALVQQSGRFAAAGAGARVAAGSLSSALGGPVGIAAISLAVGSGIRSQIKADADKRRDELLKEYADQEEEGLRLLVEEMEETNPDSTVKQLKDYFSGSKSSKEIARDAFQVKQADTLLPQLAEFMEGIDDQFYTDLRLALNTASDEQVEAVNDLFGTSKTRFEGDLAYAGGPSEIDPDLNDAEFKRNIEKAIAEFKNDPQSNDAANKIAGLQTLLKLYDQDLYNQYFGAKISTVKETAAIIKEIEEAEGTPQGLDTIAAAYESGQGNIYEYINKIDENIAQYREALSYDANNTKVQGLLTAAIIKRSEILAESIQNTAELQATITELNGGVDTQFKVVEAIQASSGTSFRNLSNGPRRNFRASNFRANDFQADLGAITKLVENFEGTSNLGAIKSLIARLENPKLGAIGELIKDLENPDLGAISEMVESLQNANNLGAISELVDQLENPGNLGAIIELVESFKNPGDLGAITQLVESFKNPGNLGVITQLIESFKNPGDLGAIIELVDQLKNPGDLGAITKLVESFESPGDLGAIIELVDQLENPSDLGAISELVDKLKNPGDLGAIIELVESFKNPGDLGAITKLVESFESPGDLGAITQLVESFESPGDLGAITELVDKLKNPSDLGAITQLVEKLKNPSDLGAITDLVNGLGNPAGLGAISEMIDKVKNPASFGAIIKLVEKIKSPGSAAPIAAIEGQLRQADPGSFLRDLGKKLEAQNIKVDRTEIERQISNKLDLLKNKDYDAPEARKQTALELTGLLQDLIKERAENARSEAERSRILSEGLDLETEAPGLRSDLVEAQLGKDNKSVGKYLAARELLTGVKTTYEEREEIVNTLAKEILDGQTDRLESMKRLLERAVKNLYNQLAALKRYGEDDPDVRAKIAQYESAIGEIDSISPSFGVAVPGLSAVAVVDPKEEAARVEAIRDAQAGYAQALAGGDQLSIARIQLSEAQRDVQNAMEGSAEQYDALTRVAQAQNDIRNAVQALTVAQLEYSKVLTDDPIAKAGFDLQIANVALSTAQQNNDPVGVYAALGQIKAANDAAEAAQFDLINARAELFAAQVSDNPVAAAQAGIDAADRAYDQAKTEAQRIRASIQKIQAQRQLRDVILDIAASQTELVQALLTYAGDNRGAAEQGIAQAERDLQVAIASGDQAAINRAQVNLIAMRQTMDDVIASERQSAEELVQAQRQGDARGQAEAALRAAEAAYAAAKGPEEKNRTLAALLTARRTFEETIIDEAVAGQELAGATFSANGNALGAAYAAMAAASIRLEALTRQGAGKAEILRARAAYVQAAGAVRNAIQDTISAQFELIEAVASAAGRTVEAAEAALANAQAKLAAAQNGGGQAEILRARADVVRQEAAVRDARLSEGQSDIDFALQMEQITTQQAITQLEALLQVPKITKQQTQQLLLKIKSLRDELGGDLQFNIPSFLGLPTLYTARRLNDSNGGFQDNRQYQIIVNPSPGMDEEALANLVLDRAGAQISTPVYSPTYDRMY